MRIRSILVSLLGLGVLHIAGCGDPSSPSISREQFLAQLPATLCARDVRCGQIGPSEESSCRGPARLDRWMALPQAFYGEALAAGRLRYDGQAAAKCLEYYRAGHCDINGDNYDDFWACFRIYRPLVADGGACFINTDCRSGSCQGAASQGCPGVCRPASGCNRLACDEDQFCNERNPTCTPRRGLGASCDSPADHDACQAGLICINSVCSVPAQTGGACAPTQGLCAAGLHCDFDTVNCQPRSAAGGVCRLTSDCRDGLLCVGATPPSTSGICKPTLDFPSACDPDLATAASVCPLYAYCDANTRQCIKSLQPGASCATENCTFGSALYCEEATLTCQVAGTLGATCTPPSSSDPRYNPCLPGICDPATRKCALVCQ